MNVIILAAGMGTRLLPETQNIPKGMVKLFNKSLIEMQIDIFKKCEINTEQDLDFARKKI